MADRCDPKIVTGEWSRTVRELLKVGVCGCVGQADRRRPGVAAVDRLRREDVQGRADVAGGVVSDGALRRVTPIGPAIPPQGVQDTAVSRNSCEELMPRRLGIDQLRRGRHSGHAVITDEIRARLARDAGCKGTIAGSAGHHGSGNGGVEDSVDEFIDLVVLIGSGRG